MPPESPDSPKEGAPPAAPPATPPATAPQPPQDPAATPPSLFDAAAEAEAAPARDADGKAIRPEWLPENFWDPEAGAYKPEALAKSWLDMRKIVSRGEHKPPADEAGYALPAIEGLPEGFVPADDPVWADVRKAALGAGLTAKQLEAVAAPMLAHALKARAEPAAPAAPDPEAERRAFDAELAKLGPGGRQYVRDIDAWLRGLHGRGALTDEELADLRGVSTAAGVRAIGKLRELAGEQPIPVDMFEEGAMTQRDAERLLQEGFAQNDQGKVESARRALQQLERRGQLRR